MGFQVLCFLGAVLVPWTHASLRGCDLGFPRPLTDSWAREKRKQERKAALEADESRGHGDGGVTSPLPHGPMSWHPRCWALSVAVAVLVTPGPSRVHCGVDVGLRTPRVSAPVPAGPPGLAALTLGRALLLCGSPHAQRVPRGPPAPSPGVTRRLCSASIWSSSLRPPPSQGLGQGPVIQLPAASPAWLREL